MPFTCVEVPAAVEIDETVDIHMHLRALRKEGDGRMEMNMRHIVGYHAIIAAIGNGTPAVLDQKSAAAHVRDARSCLASGEELEIYAGALLTDRTTAEMVREMRAHKPRTVLFLKAFLSGVSNDGGNSVSDFCLIDEAIAATYDNSVDAPSLPVEVHAERKFTAHGQRIPMADREWYAVNYYVRQLLKRHPKIRLVIKHVTDWRTLRQIRQWRTNGYDVYDVYAEICPHYLFRCHDDLFEGPGGGTAFRGHELCWPLYKDERSMEDLRRAALSGESWVLYGADMACHIDDPTRETGSKISDSGIIVGGVTILPSVAMSMVIDLFLKEDAAEHLDAYLSRNARQVHHLPPATKKVRYVHEPWTVPLFIEGAGPRRKKIRAQPFMRGATCNWKLAV